MAPDIEATLSSDKSALDLQILKGRKEKKILVKSGCFLRGDSETGGMANAIGLQILDSLPKASKGVPFIEP